MRGHRSAGLWGLAALLLGACAVAEPAGGGPRADAAWHDVDGAAEPADAAAELADGAPPSVDAAPPDASAPDATCTQVTLTLDLANPGFELGPGVGWLETTSQPIVRADQPVTADSGAFIAWLGGGYALDQRLDQPLVLPERTLAVRLRGRLWIASAEFLPDAFDTLDIELWSAGHGARLTTLASYSNTDETAAWTDFTATATGPFGATSVELSFTAVTDLTYNTNFFVDTLALELDVCD